MIATKQPGKERALTIYNERRTGRVRVGRYLIMCAVDLQEALDRLQAITPQVKRKQKDIEDDRKAK